MRVLWFSNAVHPDAARKLGQGEAASGAHLWVLAEQLAGLGHELGIVTLGPGLDDQTLRFANLTQVIVGVPSYSAGVRPPSPDLCARYRRAVDEFQPDITQICGTEQHYGLLPGLGVITGPVVVDIQGIIRDVARYWFGGLAWREIAALQTPLAFIRGRPPVVEWLHYRRQVKLEERILSGNTTFTVRGGYDRQFVKSINAAATFHAVDRSVRTAFFACDRSESSVRPRSIFACCGSYPLKGAHWLLRAAAAVRRAYPDVTVRVANTQFAYRRPAPGYARYLGRLARQLSLTDVIEPLGILTAEQMVNELQRAEVFVCPSMAEAGPIVLAEALVAGTPVVASRVGGIPHLTRDGQDALLCPPGDAGAMADCICKVFGDPASTRDLAARARERARVRHLPARVAAAAEDAYRKIVAAPGVGAGLPNGRAPTSAPEEQQA